MIRAREKESGNVTGRTVLMSTHLRQLVKAALPVAKVVVGIDDGPIPFVKRRSNLTGFFRGPEGQWCKLLPIGKVDRFWILPPDFPARAGVLTSVPRL